MAGEGVKSKAKMPSNVDKLKILGKMYRLSLLLCGYVEKFNRAYKFTLGNRVVHALFAKVRWHNRVLGTSAALRRRHAERFANLLNSYLGLMRHFRTCNIRRRAAEEVLAVWADCISFSPDFARAMAAPRCRSLDRVRHRAGREHIEDLQFLKTNLL